jgi:hypothetical protein
LIRSWFSLLSRTLRYVAPRMVDWYPSPSATRQIVGLLW